MAEGARLDPTPLEVGVDVAPLQADYSPELVGGQLTSVDDAVEGHQLGPKALVAAGAPIQSSPVDFQPGTR